MAVAAAPEIWMQPNPLVSLFELQRLVRERAITRTPRLGVRDEHHPKGYAVGQRVPLRLLDSHGEQQSALVVAVTGLTVCRLTRLQPGDLEGCGPMFRRWQDVARVLSFFEKRPITPSEPVTIVSFNYASPPPP